MIHIWRTITDALFPPSPALVTLRQYKTVPYNNYYDPHPVADTIALAHYQSPLIKASITAGKFEHNIEALSALGLLFRRYLAEHPATHPPASTIVTYIPLHPKRERERGYNQVRVIVDAALRDTLYRTVPLLYRTTHTTPQSHLKRAERLSHLAGVFAYRECSIDWRTVTNVILVDDVLTTGSTIEAARDVLRPKLPKGVKLYTVAMAH